MLRRNFLELGIGALAGASSAAALQPPVIIDIHQHVHYWGRTDSDLLRHQVALGAARTVLLPSGSRYGLEADCYGNDACQQLASRFPKRFCFFANESPEIAGSRAVIERYLKAGAVGIGEQKFFVECDSSDIDNLATLAADFQVPILMHFQYGKYNTGFTRFHKVLEKHPRVIFIGHAQTWWANIDAKADQSVLYPKNKVTPGGLTDKWLSDYPNMYGDLSAGSGVNSILRDEDMARDFLLRHQDKLLFGSDCQDPDTRGDVCSGRRQLENLRRLIKKPQVLNKILSANARKIIRGL